MWLSGRNWYHLQNKLRSTLQITEHFNERGMNMAPAKSAVLAFTRKKCPNFLIEFQGHVISFVTSYRFLAVALGSWLSWSLHIA